MWKDIKNHVVHYFVLFLILAFWLLGFRYYSYQPALQRMIVILAATSYAVWGITHHLLEKNLNLKIVVEYTVMATLAATLLLIMIGVSS